MSNAKEKAKELVYKFSFFVLDVNSLDEYCAETELNMSKVCAKIAVEELIKALHLSDTAYDLIPSIEYWQDVLKEIDLL